MEVIDDCLVLFPGILPNTLHKPLENNKKKKGDFKKTKKTQVLLQFNEYNAGCHELS